MQIKTKELGDNIIKISLIGEIDLFRSQMIKDMINKNIADGITNIIIDLEDVRYIDSTGIGSLIYCRSTIKQKGGKLILLNIKDSVERVFRLTKLDSLFTILDDENEALKQF